MTNRFCLLVIIFTNLSGKVCIAQNLVQNSSFENYTFCPTQENQLYYSVGWTAVGGVANYFNSCAPACGIPMNCVGVPYSFFGFQYAYQGNAYVGIITRSSNSPNQRDYITTPIGQLIIGTRYFVSAYICRANGIRDYGASNNFGFRFYTTFTYPITQNNFSHINDTILVTDSVNWTKVSGSFIADSAYQYVTIGNFYDDAHTDTLDIKPNPGFFENYAYYFIDNVCVSPDSLTCNLINGINSVDSKINFNLFPNPFSDKLNIENKTNEQSEIIIYDVFSRKILQQQFSNSISIDTHEFKTGIYFYQFYNNHELLRNGKIIKK